MGLPRLYAPAEFGTLPRPSVAEVHAGLTTGNNLRSLIDEYAQAPASMAEAGSFTTFGAKPLVVLTAGSGSDAAWIAGHERLAAMSSNSSHRVIDGATHEELIADEKKSTATSRAILDVVSAIRHSTPLGK